MFEVINLNESKILVKSLNVIIYGTIRDIEDHFIKSFTNIDLLCKFFNNVYIIIFENDSIDNTRQLLINWTTCNNNNIIKKIILEDNLNQSFPLRAHRLAYCRNKILNYIFDNNLNIDYQYAIHCDLDDRFWSLDYDSIFNCFQYDLNTWDGMFPINTNYSYYDFWALRCNETWFNKNIFSCEIENNETFKEFEKHTSELNVFFMNNKNKLISVNSAFNGIGIYKLNSLKNSRYSASYKCNKCYNQKLGCSEDNDHIGLHKSMLLNNCKLFINTKMVLENKNKDALNYSQFIVDLKNIPNINKNVLKYVLYSKILDNNYLWLNFSQKLGIYENTLSNFTTNKVFSFCNYNNDLYSNNLINNNVISYVGNLSKNLYEFIRNNNDDLISFIHIDFNSYHDTKNLFDKLYKKINNSCIIVINKFINFNEYLLNDLHAFYEFTQKYNIKFNYIGINGEFSLTPINNNDTSVAIKIIENPHLSKIEITDKLFLYEDIYINFDWVKYIESNKDLANIEHKEDAWHHWYYYGKNENRKYYAIENINENNDFNWKKYIEHNNDLKHIKTKEEAWHHWINYGKNENRKYYKNEDNNQNNNQDDNSEFNDFDWERYILNAYDLKHIKTKEEAWHHWINYGKNENRQYFIKNDMYDNFDWRKYVKKNIDLINLNNKEEAWNHWITYGKKEGRVFYFKKDYLNEIFDWEFYVQNNEDLKHITTKEEALYHWINYGKKEGRNNINNINNNCIKFSNFDWKYYIENNEDLKHIKTKEEAWEHWFNLGKHENRLFKKKIKKTHLFL
jgi:hypothetical protein